VASKAAAAGLGLSATGWFNEASASNGSFDYASQVTVISTLLQQRCSSFLFFLPLLVLFAGHLSLVGGCEDRVASLDTSR
jgi:hypothetical protein